MDDLKNPTEIQLFILQDKLQLLGMVQFSWILFIVKILGIRLLPNTFTMLQWNKQLLSLQHFFLWLHKGLLHVLLTLSSHWMLIRLKLSIFLWATTLQTPWKSLHTIACYMPRCVVAARPEPLAVCWAKVRELSLVSVPLVLCCFISVFTVAVCTYVSAIQKGQCLQMNFDFVWSLPEHWVLSTWKIWT